MKKSIIITLLGIFVAGMVVAQSEKTVKLPSFSSISAHEAIDVYIRKGNKQEAKIVSKNIDIEEVLTEVKNGHLKIHLDGNNSRNVDVEVYVTYQSINAIRSSSSASITSEGIIQSDGDFGVKISSSSDVNVSIEGIDELSINVSSSGSARLKVKANEIDAGVSSSGKIEVMGVVERQNIDASSSGDYNGYGLESDDARASASSGGSIKINVKTKLDAKASSGGSVKYKGSPTYLNADSNSGGSVRKS